MIKDFRSIDDKLKQKIIYNFKKTYKISELQKIYPSLEYNVLYSVIYSAKSYNKRLNNQIYQVNLQDDILIFISDTHDGSKFESRYYKDKVFDFAAANGVKTILHCGDYIQSTDNSYIHVLKNKNVISQAQKFIDKYPKDPNITTYGVYGNHDLQAININENVRKILESRSDFKTLGFKKAYILWRGHIISIQHDINDFKLCLPTNLDYLSFKGHHHSYHVKKVTGKPGERVYVPTLSDAGPADKRVLKSIEESGLKVTPGFVTAEDYPECTLVTYFTFKYGTIVREDEFIKPKSKKLIIE